VPGRAGAAPPRRRARHAARSGDAAAAAELAELVAELGLQDLELLIRTLTRGFALMNLAEDNDRVRRIRKLDEGSSPRRGSREAAIVHHGGLLGLQQERRLRRLRGPSRAA